MNIWKKMLMLIIFILALISTFLIFNLTAFNNGGKILFASFKSGYSWQTSKKVLSGYTQNLQKTLGFPPMVVIIITPGLQKTGISTGWGDNNAIFYGKWSRLFGWNIFNIYVDISEIKKVSLKTASTILNYFVIGEINVFYNLDRNSISPGNLFLDQ